MFKISNIYFSPTGTTACSVNAILSAMSNNSVNILDLTYQDYTNVIQCEDRELAFVSMPVYSGRLPQLAVKRFSKIKGNNTPVVLVVVYGNRHYDDALVELYDLCIEQGFRPIAAISMIGEHSFASEKFPIASHRPDQDDLNIAHQFGEKIAELLSTKKDNTLNMEKIPGNRPYRANKKFTAIATYIDNTTCLLCAKCVDACPAGIIRLENGKIKTMDNNCIWCLACVHSCPTKARKVGLPIIAEYAEKLNKNCNVRKKPELFI